MFNLKDITRPSFRPGFDPPISSSHKPKIIRPARNISRNEPLGMRTRTFASDAPIPRQVPDFMRERKIKEQTEGIMVQLGPGTLTKMLTVTVPDVNNPAIDVTRNVSLAELLQSQKGQLAGIESILRDFNTSARRGSQLTREEIGKLTALVAKAFDKESRLTEKGIVTTLKTSGKTARISLAEMGITKNIVTIDDIPSEYYGLFCSRMINHRLIPYDDLSPAKPVYGVSGKPIDFKHFRSRMRERYRLDIRKRLMLHPLEEKKDEFGDEDEPDPMFEEEEDEAGLHIDPQPPKDETLYERFIRETGRSKEREKKDHGRSRSSPKKEISVAEAKRRAEYYKKKKQKKKGLFSGLW
ncbi:MAG: hypothetical protein GY804_05210 [Alphaproteobacteria bacterium]|nr:hypothetical protein [Alphaproteobacteria bacterium]